MKKCNRLNLYYSLFSTIVESPRIMPKGIAKKFNYSGRGRASSTFLRHIDNMYRAGISFEPKLALKPYENVRTFVYFCRKKESKGINATFNQLKEDKRITYTIVLSGSDFFITSRDSPLDLGTYGLEIWEKSALYTPLYTIPKGWDKPMSVTLENFTNFPFENDGQKNLLDRKTYGVLSWDDLDWKIFHMMKSNVRRKLSTLTQIGTNYNTIKNHFLKKVLPSCTIAHYFFPKGYDYYQKLILSLKTQYETGFVNAFERLPCTTVVFPLERNLFVVLFHERMVEMLNAIEKLEEEAIIDDYFLFNPLMHDYP